MPNFSYHCVDCGALLTPEDVVYDISGIAFFGALAGDYSQFPIYANKERMDTLFTWNEGRGKSTITLLDWIMMLYQQCGDQLDPGTREKDASSAYQKFENLLKRQKEQEEYTIGSVEVAVIPGLPDNLSRILVSNCGDKEICDCTIQYDNQYGYSFIDFADRTNFTSYSDHRCCRQCHSMLLERAFQCEHTLIGFIGFQRVGKTCLIAALCKYLDYAAPGCQLLLRNCDEAYFRRELKRYQNGFSLKQTNRQGTNKVNPTIYLEDGERPARMLTFVDISGEAFNNDEGKFNPALMENNFRAIAECSLYIFCTSLMAFEASDFGGMQLSLGNFINHITRTGSRATPSPILVTVMQMDEPTNCVENRKDVPYLEEYLYHREYNQIYNVRESDQLKALLPSETDRKLIDGRLQSLMTSVNAKLYYTSITCSAYGRQPVDQTVINRDDASTRRRIDAAIKAGRPMQLMIQTTENADDIYERYQQSYGNCSDIIEIIKPNMDSSNDSIAGGFSDMNGDLQFFENSPLQFKPNPRNINLIYDWIMRMIGEREIPSRLKDRAPLPPMDCRQMSIHDYHTNETDVQAIARMFVNPHQYDRRFYKIIQEPALFSGFLKRSYLSTIAKAKATGEPLHHKESKESRLE